LLAAAVLIAGSPLLAEEPPGSPVQPYFLTSPYHGVTDGNGNTIPCRCRFKDRAYRLGELVCMPTALGSVFARCDLLLNNTSWVPTGTPCQVSAITIPLKKANER
jgi:hypothetical protein